MFGLGRKGVATVATEEGYYSIVTWEKGYVRASVVQAREGKAELVGVAAAPVHGIGRTSHPDLDRWYAGCNRALTEAEDMTLRFCGSKMVPDCVAMAVPVEVTHSLPIAVSLRRQEPERSVSFDELRFLAERGYRKAQDVQGSGVREPMGRAGARLAAEDIIHGVVGQVSLDGQVADDSMGLRGGRLEMQLTFTIAPVEWIRALEIVAERLRMQLTAIVPHHVAYASSLADATALLVLLDDHQTITTMVRYGRPVWAAVAPLGERELANGTAEALGLHGRQADALLRAYRASQLREDVGLQLGQAFWIELRRWMVALADAIKGAKQEATVPARIYFLDLTHRMPEAQPALQTPFWEDCLPFERCPEIIELGPAAVGDVIDVTSQASGPGYLALRALAHHVAQLNAPANVLDRVLVESIRVRRPSLAANKR